MATRNPEHFPGDIILAGSTSGQLRVRANASTTSHTITYPAAQGSADQVLTNDGSGGLSWAASGGNTMQLVPAAISVAAGDFTQFVTMFKDTTGAPDRCVVVTILSTTTIALVEYKLLGNAWVFDPGDCARDTSVTLNFTAASSQIRITAFAIDSPVASGNRILFIAGNNDDTTDTFEIDSIVLTPGGTTLSATAVVIAGANPPADTNLMATQSIPLSTTRVMTFFEDDAHFADVTESAGTYTFTYTDSIVTAVDTSIVITGTGARNYSGMVIGAQVVLLNASGAITGNSIWEMSTSAVLTEEFVAFRVGLMDSDQSSGTLGAAGIAAIGGAFAVANPVGGDSLDGQEAGYIISTFPLDSL